MVLRGKLWQRVQVAALSSILIYILSACTAITYEDNSSFTVINIRTFDRAQLGYLLKKVVENKPKLVLLDFRLSQRKDPYADSIFQQAVINSAYTPLIYASSFRVFEVVEDSIIASDLRDTDPYFKKGNSTQGYTDTFSRQIQGKPVMDAYPAMVYHNNSIQYHAGVICAATINSEKTEAYLSGFGAKRALQLKQERIEQYNTIDLSFEELQQYDWSEVKGQIVAFGYIGSTDEDKKYTYLNVNDFTYPDTYGVFIIIEIISEILNIH